MNKQGKREAQTMMEMVTDMNEAKTKELSVVRGKSRYKAESGEYQEEKLKGLISLNMQELAEVATKKRVSLDDIDEIKQRTICYVRACYESGTFPSNLGLARSLGYTARALRDWKNKRPNTETAQWLEMFSEMCADILNQSALKNNANNIMAIFLNKALYEFRETNELVLTPNAGGMNEEVTYSADEIRARYITNDSDESGD